MNDSIETAQHGNAKAAVLQIDQSNFTKLRVLTEADLSLVPILLLNGMQNFPSSWGKER